MSEKRIYLPPEILDNIFSQTCCSRETLRSVMSTCQRFREVALPHFYTHFRVPRLDILDNRSMFALLDNFRLNSALAARVLQLSFNTEWKGIRYSRPRLDSGVDDPAHLQQRAHYKEYVKAHFGDKFRLPDEAEDEWILNSTAQTKTHTFYTILISLLPNLEVLNLEPRQENPELKSLAPRAAVAGGLQKLREVTLHNADFTLERSLLPGFWQLPALERLYFRGVVMHNDLKLYAQDKELPGIIRSATIKHIEVYNGWCAPDTVSTMVSAAPNLQSIAYQMGKGYFTARQFPIRQIHEALLRGKDQLEWIRLGIGELKPHGPEDRKSYDRKEGHIVFKDFHALKHLAVAAICIVMQDLMPWKEFISDDPSYEPSQEAWAEAFPPGIESLHILECRTGYCKYVFAGINELLKVAYTATPNLKQLALELSQKDLDTFSKVIQDLKQRASDMGIKMECSEKL